MTGTMRMCEQCGLRPPAMREIPYCFECWPGGPVTSPPCRRCGSAREYYTSGLCARCHPHAPGQRSPAWKDGGQGVIVDSCPDCCGWGVTRTYGWHIRVDHVSLAEATRGGQQLFFAIGGMFHQEGLGKQPYAKKTVPPDMSLLRPVTHRQLVLLDWPRDLRAGMRAGFPPVPDLALEAALHEFTREHAARLGWAKGKAERVQRGIRIMLAIQDTPRSGDPPKRRRPVVVDQALRRRGVRRPRRGGHAGRRPRARHRPLVQRRGPRPA
jgi:hypothetical protein